MLAAIVGPTEPIDRWCAVEENFDDFPLHRYLSEQKRSADNYTVDKNFGSRNMLAEKYRLVDIQLIIKWGLSHWMYFQRVRSFSQLGISGEAFACSKIPMRSFFRLLYSFLYYQIECILYPRYCSNIFLHLCLLLTTCCLSGCSYYWSIRPREHNKWNRVSNSIKRFNKPTKCRLNWFFDPRRCCLSF